MSIFAIFYGYYSGFFNNQQINLENKKHDIGIQIDSFIKQRNALNFSLVNEKAVLRDSLLKERERMIDNFGKIQYSYQINILKLEKANFDLHQKVISNKRLENIKAISSKIDSYPATNITIYGFVYDSENKPISGAKLNIVGWAATWAITDINGYFIIMLPRYRLKEGYKIEASASGYDSIEVTVKNDLKESLRIILKKERKPHCAI